MRRSWVDHLLEVFILAVAATVLVVYLSWRVDGGGSERIYQVSFGSVLCSDMQVEPCGVMLSKCADTFTYRCLQNVRYESANP